MAGRKRSAAPAARSSFRPEIEGLRAVAVLLAIAFHVWDQPAGGFIGIELFFVISGFLITSLLVREHDRTGRISIADFYRRRVRRILPAAITVLVACWLAARVLFYPARAHATIVDILWSAGFAANIHFAAAGTDYFHADQAVSPVQHYWSLAVEEQFYVVWPLLLIVLLALSGRIFGAHKHLAVLIVTALIVIALFVWAVALTAQNQTAAYFSAPARAWELGVGAVLALASRYLRWVPVRLSQVAIVAGLAGLAVSAIRIGSDFAIPAPWSAPPVFAAALIIMGGARAGQSWVAWPLTNPVSRYLGRISYSLYLWHWPIIIFLVTRLTGSRAYFDTVVLLATGAISVLSYHFVESPFRALRWSALRRRSSRARVGSVRLEARARGAAAFAAVTLAACAGAVWVARPVVNGPDVSAFQVPVASAAPSTGATSAAVVTRFGQVTPPAALAASILSALQATSFPVLHPGIGDLSNARAAQWKTCGNVGAKQLDRCTFTATNSTAPAKKAVVIGDSIAISWLPALMDLRSHGYTVYALTFGQCPAAQVTVDQSVGADSGFGAECDAHRDWAVSEVAALKPDIAVLASSDQTVERLHSKAKGADAVAEWTRGTTQIIQRVKAAGAKRVVTLSAPPPAASLVACAPTSSASPAGCVGAVTAEWHQVADAESAQAQASQTAYVDSHLLFCAANDYCPSFIGTTPVRIDGIHLTDAYSTSLGPILSPLVIG